MTAHRLPVALRRLFPDVKDITDAHLPVKFDAMCRAIAEAHKIDELTQIRDKALLLQTAMRMAKNVENERLACEIRLRSERRAGQLLKDMQKAKGTRGQLAGRDSSGPTVMEGPEEETLGDLGVTYRQSSQWQKLADIPEKRFEEELAQAEMPSTRRIIRLVEQSVEQFAPPTIIVETSVEQFPPPPRPGDRARKGYDTVRNRARTMIVALLEFARLAPDTDIKILREVIEKSGNAEDVRRALDEAEKLRRALGGGEPEADTPKLDMHKRLMN